MNTTTSEKKIDYFKWAISIMVTIIMGLSVMSANLLVGIRTTQATQQAEISRITAIQNINTEAIASLTKRVGIIEADKISEVKQWVMDNFVQKGQIK